MWHLTVSATKGKYELHDWLGDEFKLEVGEAPAQVQAALEGLYGVGNVQVTGGPGPEHTNPYEVYEIKFVGRCRIDMRLLQECGISSPELSGGRERAELKVAEGRPAGVIVVSAVNLGDAPANPATQPIAVTDKLPPGLEAVWIEADAGGGATRNFTSPLACSLGSLSCTFTGNHPTHRTACRRTNRFRCVLGSMWSARNQERSMKRASSVVGLLRRVRGSR